MNEKKIFFTIETLFNIIGIYFDTFLVFYFFQIANYQVEPLAKYYFTFYLFIPIGFYIIRHAIKKNVKVPYFRIGISMQAIYIALIMLLKEKIIDYIIIVGIIKGLAEGFYYYPKNLLNTEKVDNTDRRRFNGVTMLVKKVISIIIPLILGVLLTYYSYTDIGKIFFLLFIVMFGLTFLLKDKEYTASKSNIKEFWKLIKENKNLKKSLWPPFLAGFTYSSGVMTLIVTLAKINNFKTNLNLGFVDSLCAVLSLILTAIYTWKTNKKHLKSILLSTGILSFITLFIFGIYPTKWALILYLIVRFSCILLINLISNEVVVNISNSKELDASYKPEFYFVREIMFSISRCLGYLLLFVIISIFGVSTINYLLIICAIAILSQSIVVAKLCEIDTSNA